MCLCVKELPTNAIKKLTVLKKFNTLTKSTEIITANFAKSNYTSLTKICRDVRTQTDAEQLAALRGPGFTK